jgi:hypothetical protein
LGDEFRCVWGKEGARGSACGEGNEEDEGRGGMRSGEIDLVFFGFLCIYFIDRYGVLYLGLLLVTGDNG